MTDGSTVRTREFASEDQNKQAEIRVIIEVEKTVITEGEITVIHATADSAPLAVAITVFQESQGPHIQGSSTHNSNNNVFHKIDLETNSKDRILIPDFQTSDLITLISSIVIQGILITRDHRGSG